MENGPTVSRCFAELPVLVLDGCGIVKTMYGRRCTASTRRDGYTSMLAKKLGTNPGFMQKVSLSLRCVCVETLLIKCNRLG